MKSLALFLTIAITMSPVAAMAAGKSKPVAMTEDRVQILSNLPVGDSPIIRFTFTERENRSYVYLEHLSRALTLLDITDPRRPTIASRFELPPDENGLILSAPGETALVGSGTESTTPLQRKTLSLVSFADLARPQTLRRFTGVTCAASNDRRDLILVANQQGVWILHRVVATDQQVQDRYSHEILYSH